MHKRKLQSMKITTLNLVSPYLIKAGDTQELLLGGVVKTQTNKQKNSWINLMGIAFSFIFFLFLLKKKQKQKLLVTKERIVYLKMPCLLYESVTKKSMQCTERKRKVPHCN